LCPERKEGGLAFAEYKRGGRDTPVTVLGKMKSE